MQELYFGIDLGTTNSKAAFLDYRELQEPKPTPLKLNQAIEKGTRRTWKHVPSVVLFERDGRTVFVGEYARRYSVNFPDRSVRAVKRLMGKNWRHKVPGWSTPWTPQGISAIILKKIRSEALESLHDTRDDLSSVTISVPASFGSRQREATIEAARLAGFSGKVALIDEPSAALMHYIHDRKEKGQEVDFARLNRILVFDMGGGTLDVSLAQVEPRDGHLHLRVLSRSRYTELAGTEFDLLLAAYVVQRLAAKGSRMPENPRDRKDVFRSILFDVAEPLKRRMSDELTGYFNWGYVREGPPFDIDDPSRVGCTIVPRERELDTSEGAFEIPDLYVSFEHFEHVLEPFFKPENPEENPQGIGTIYGPIYTVLKEAQLSKEDIDVVLMHGGMCELLLIQVGLMNYFPASTLVTASPDPMTSVALGAALYQARDRQGSLMEVEEPALFESIFYEHEGGFALAVSKDQRVGEWGVLELPITRGTRRVRLRLHQGFDETDPLLTHDRDMRIELPETAPDGYTIQLRWEVKPNRAVAFTWQDPTQGDTWQALVEVSTGKRGAWYPEDVRRAEADNVESLEIL